ncbi:MAG: YbaB/EbfC family nucleoid-associated protein [Lentisphaerae bacterium]|nr:YbaB/EbfC family nucleoid-associated protein [Lentisphaerota bacterium]
MANISNMFKMLKDAASMQRNVKKIQAELRQKTVEYTGGKVTVTARGDASIATIRIDPSVIDPARPAALEKMVLTAVEGALEAAREMSAREMKKIVSDMGLPDIPGL